MNEIDLRTNVNLSEANAIKSLKKYGKIYIKWKKYVK